MEILDATDGILRTGRKTLRVRGVCTDTRAVRKNELFIAIKGDTFDGHDFIANAVASGASAVLVSRPGCAVPEGVAVIEVKDTVKALGYIARHYRRRFKVPVIAITGSCGKTTTKEMIASVLKTTYTVLYNKGTENNHIGVPMTLLKLKTSHDVAVIEAGTNHPGEIRWLAEICCPTIAVFTNVGPSHLEGLGTPEGVFQEKVTLLEGLPRDGVVIANADDIFLAGLLKRKLTQKQISYGIVKKADVAAKNIAVDARKIAFSVGREPMVLNGPVWGNIYNALAAIACGLVLKVLKADIGRGVRRFRSPKGRQVFHRVGRVTVIDDTYNANPVSFRNSVLTLKVLKGKGRAILIAADMLELGSSAEPLHADVGVFAADQGVDMLLTCGSLARVLGDAARQKNPKVVHRHFKDKDTLSAFIQKETRPYDVVLVKGSRGMRMEKIVEDILSSLKG
ncbi:MAG: UDP-N-acetylmuramoyl-tripeptide--D-alanyl-D-alanine ligase [Candidatus Omnitrophica bacterium]|nr:UDP-N-acetylmuramoyl-tripeptide--D-alanyl-D-alanine ligase [Candidatus Omnitrophota bacterium]